jgi:hypothetical protein
MAPGSAVFSPQSLVDPRHRASVRPVRDRADSAVVSPRVRHVPELGDAALGYCRRGWLIVPMHSPVDGGLIASRSGPNPTGCRGWGRPAAGPPPAPGRAPPPAACPTRRSAGAGTRRRRRASPRKLVLRGQKHTPKDVGPGSLPFRETLAITRRAYLRRKWTPSAIVHRELVGSWAGMLW